MIMLTPTRRLEWLREQRDISVAHEAIDQLLKRYEEFLKRTDESEEQLVQRFMDKGQSSDFLKPAYEFGDLVFEVFDRIGNKNRFHRLLVA